MIDLTKEIETKKKIINHMMAKKSSLFRNVCKGYIKYKDKYCFTDGRIIFFSDSDLGFEEEKTFSPNIERLMNDLMKRTFEHTEVKISYAKLFKSSKKITRRSKATRYEIKRKEKESIFFDVVLLIDALTFANSETLLINENRQPAIINDKHGVLSCVIMPMSPDL